MFCEYCKHNFTDFPQICPECRKKTNLYGIDLTTTEGIRSINPHIKQNVDMLNQPYYILQRIATTYKKDNIDLAIECLRKSNEISNTFDHPPLLAKEYMRLVTFLRTANRLEEAEQAEQQIRQKHPEFWDKRITNAKNAKEVVARAKQWKEDLLLVTCSRNCRYCSQYNRQVYSISGKSKTFPKLPNELLTGVCPDHYISIHQFFEGINTVPDEARLLHPQ